MYSECIHSDHGLLMKITLSELQNLHNVMYVIYIYIHFFIIINMSAVTCPKIQWLHNIKIS